jgi:AcrR family transcriptional regulator
MNGVQPGTTPRGDKEGRRRDILEAAKALLFESGYASFGMRALAKRAGISSGALYLYFHTKEEIFLTLYGERIDRLRVDALEAAEKAESLEELIRRFADGYLEFYRELGRHLNLLAVLADPKADVPEDLIDHLRAQVVTIFLELGRRIEALAHAEGRTVLEPRMTLPLLWSVLGGLADSYTGAKSSAQPFPWDEMADFAARTLVRGLTEAGRSDKR